MKTILDILRTAGGYRSKLHLRIENPPHLPLVIEALPVPGPLGLLAISVAHYGDLKGDLMCDPEMLFELSKPLGGGYALDPFYWRNDYMGIEHRSRALQNGNYLYLSETHREHRRFAQEWDDNLMQSGFVAAFRRGYGNP
jgi:hypothetical protein